MGGEAFPLDSRLVILQRKLNEVKKAGVSKGGWGLEVELPFPCKHELRQGGQGTTQNAISFAVGASKNRKIFAPAVSVCSQCLEELWEPGSCLETVLRAPGRVAHALGSEEKGLELGLKSWVG